METEPLNLSEVVRHSLPGMGCSDFDPKILPQVLKQNLEIRFNPKGTHWCKPRSHPKLATDYDTALYILLFEDEKNLNNIVHKVTLIHIGINNNELVMRLVYSYLGQVEEVKNSPKYNLSRVNLYKDCNEFFNKLESLLDFALSQKYPACA